MRERKSSVLSPSEQLLQAAGDLMSERGISDISLSEIAQRSGLNSSLIKYYFGNKSGLMIALLRRAMKPGLEQLEHLVKSRATPTDKLRIHISGMVTTYFRFPYVNRLMHQILADDELKFGLIMAEEFGRPVAEAQRLILEEGVKLGYFRPVDPMLFYFEITGACDTLFYQRYALRYIFNIDVVDDTLRRRYADHLFGIVMKGLDPKAFVIVDDQAERTRAARSVLAGVDNQLPPTAANHANRNFNGSSF